MKMPQTAARLLLLLFAVGGVITWGGVADSASFPSSSSPSSDSASEPTGVASSSTRETLVEGNAPINSAVTEK